MGYGVWFSDAGGAAHRAGFARQLWPLRRIFPPAWAVADAHPPHRDLQRRADDAFRRPDCDRTIARFSKLYSAAPNETQLVVVLGITLVVVIAFNYLTELITALRMARVTAVVQFFQQSDVRRRSACCCFGAWQRDATALVAAYGIACLAANRRHALVSATAVQIAAAR